MTIGPTIRYPAGPITPHGTYYLMRDKIPQVALRSYDDSIVFNMMGGLAIADRTVPERVEIRELRGLVPPWKLIDQKGATQDGTTFIDALYDPIEVTMVVDVTGRDAVYANRVQRHLLDSLDPKLESELSWTTHELGRWWAPLRWFRTPDDPIRISGNKRRWTLLLRADNGFWQTYPDVASFMFGYEADYEDFGTAYDPGLGSNWTLGYSGAGAGHIYSDGVQALWSESGTDEYRVACRRVGYTSDDDDQVVTIRLGSCAEWHVIDQAYNDIWVRMANTGTPGDDGVRLRFGLGLLRLSSFNSGVETVLRQQPLLIPPLPGEKWTVVAGVDGNTRRYRVLRGLGAPIMNVIENGTTSQVGSSFRSAGFGMEAGAGVFSQARPMGVFQWNTGTNTTGSSQSGMIPRINIGDQPYWDRYTCFGPGTFYIGNGPGSDEMVEFGPLTRGQVMQINADPGKRGVKDLTATPATVDEQSAFANALEDFVNFATGNNVPPLLESILSIFGVQPPQGNPYSLLNGRFSEPIPGKSPGNPAEPYYVNVRIDGGDADSQIIASGTPLRRFPY